MSETIELTPREMLEYAKTELQEFANEVNRIVQRRIEIIDRYIRILDSTPGFEPGAKAGTPIGKMTMAEASRFISALFQGKHVDEVDETKSRFYRPQHRELQISTSQIQTLQNALKKRNVMDFPETMEELKKIIDDLADKKR